LWSLLTTANVDASPAVGADGVVYIGGDAKTVYALKDNGTTTPATLWSKSIGTGTTSLVRSALSIARNGTVYVATDDAKLWAFGPGPCQSSDTTCDGKDDNCNGSVDDGYVAATTNCGVGACARTGTSSCVSGAVQSNCTAGTPAASDTTCNGVDDNCNGTKDEGYAAVATNCGVGACARTGTSSCVSGAVQSNCTAGTPAASDATCNGVDDNCNGTKDEGYVAVATSCGVGACLRGGTSSCVSGAVQSNCTAGTPAASDTTCNGVDDNCNGSNDEGYVAVTTSCGVGACVRAGASSCVSGAVQSNCAPGTPAASDATCNGVDDNCNGTNDEGYVSTLATCGVGACAATGATLCISGTVQNTCTPGTPAASDTTCNGVDDNCNGTNDEGYVSTLATCGVGACAATGATLCVSGTVQNPCTPGMPAPSDTTCNGVDDNCNGTNDDGYVSTPTTCGTGACAATGATLCVSGAVQNSCTPGTPAASDATCNGVDDNCNGTNDEGYISSVMTCGAGACGTVGTTSCVAGVARDSCSAGGQCPSGEVVKAIGAGGNATCVIRAADGAVFCWGTAQDYAQVAGVTGAVQVEPSFGHTCAVLADHTVRCWGTDNLGQLGDGPGQHSGAVQVQGLSDALQVSLGEAHSCAVRMNGQVACWGSNQRGEIGDGTTISRESPVNVPGITDAVSISAGHWSTCAERATGEVVCWGNNATGQLGDGTTQPRSGPVAVASITDAVQVTAGTNFACARRRGGSVLCWGSDGQYSLGDGPGVQTSLAPVPVAGLADAVDISAGNATGCARRLGGAVMCWGLNTTGQIGDGTTTVRPAPVPVPGLTAIGIAVGFTHACALDLAGAVRCWGSNLEKQLSNGQFVDTSAAHAVVGLNDATSIDSDSFHTCALRASGQVACWGLNNDGELGDGSRVNRATAVPVQGLTSVTGTAAGFNHSCASLASGSAVCWGSNLNQILGDGTSIDRPTPVAVLGLSNVLQLNTGKSNACAVTQSGQVACWGGNPPALQTIAGVSGATKVTSFLHWCAILSNGHLSCWGANGSGQLGDGTTTSRTTPAEVSGLTQVVAVDAGESHTCAVRQNGEVWCWGNALPSGAAVPSLVPAQVAGISGATDITAGGLFSCAVRNDGSVWCWGNNALGQLGQGSRGSQSLIPLAVAGVQGAVQVAAGNTHACARLASGQVACWGNNPDGEVGEGTFNSSYVPTAVIPSLAPTSRCGNGVIEVGEACDDGNTDNADACRNDCSLGCTTSQLCAAGMGPCTVNSCAAGLSCGYGMGDRFGKTSNDDVCWDPHAGGTLGNTDTVIPDPSEYAKWDAIAVASDTACGLRQGALYCWGTSSSGALGTGPTTATALRPVRVGTATDWSQLSAGANHVCGIRTGQLYCWGANSDGQLGFSGLSQGAPVRVGAANDWSMVSAGSNHTCGIRNGGELYCWGRNAMGEQGDGTLNATSTPKRVGTANDWSSVGAGRYNTCAIRAGELWCWGQNTDAELGVGNRTNQLTPTRVGSGSDWQRISPSEHLTCGIRNGLLQCATIGAINFTQVGTLSHWQEVAVGYNYACGIESGSLYCWGLGDVATPALNPPRVGTSNEWTAVDTEFSFSTFVCGIRSGLRYCWGINSGGALGNGTTVDSVGPALDDPPLDPSIIVHLTPDSISDGLRAWDAVATGTSHACGLDSGALYCWGKTASGALGTGTQVETRLRRVRVGAAADWAALAAGADYTCGIRNGQLWCWGANGSGQLGISGSPAVPTLVDVSHDWRQISAGGEHTCAIYAGGGLYCWGRNSQGELGNGNQISTATVTLIASGGWTWVSAGPASTCGVHTGELLCWGENQYGNLGLGNQTTPVLTRRVVGTGTDWQKVSVGQSLTCGIRSGALYCSSASLNNVFTRLGTLSNWQAVAAGTNYACGIESGALYCWGDNSGGYLGIGNTTAHPNDPQRVGTLSDWTSVETQASDKPYVCATRNGQRYCWGQNDYGAFGNGATSPTPTLAPVLIDPQIDPSLWANAAPGTVIGDASTWRDARGSGITFAAPAGSTTPKVVQGQDGRPAVRFSGAQYMHASLGDTSAWQGISIVAVLTTPSTLPQFGTLLASGGASGWNDPTSAAQWAAGIGSDTTRGLGWYGSNAANGLGNGSFASSTSYVMVWKHGKGSGAGWTVRENGIPITTTPIPDATFPQGQFSAYLGAEGVNLQLSPTVRSAGSFDVSEVKIYNREITDAEALGTEREFGSTHDVVVGCSLAQPCGNGQGECISDAYCQPGLRCGFGLGGRFGLPGLNVCWDPDGGCAVSEPTDCGTPTSHCGTTCCVSNCGTAGSDDRCGGTCQACVNGADADRDGLTDCTEQNDNNPWTNPVVVNGVDAHLGANCHATPTCSQIDSWAEVEACTSFVDERRLSSGWNFATPDRNDCDSGFGFAPRWNVCRESFSVRYDALVELASSGYHCFSVSGSTQNQCGAAFFAASSDAIVTGAGARCFNIGAGVYPLHWFYETTSTGTNALHLNYCFSAQGACTPSSPIPTAILQPPSAVPPEVCSPGGSCTELCPCGPGGVCSTDLQCDPGLECRTGVGDRFGKPVNTKVCWAGECDDTNSDQFECGATDSLCGPVCPACGITPSCTGKSCGSDGCFGQCGSVCAQGQAGCESDADCASGLFCENHVPFNICVPDLCRSLSASLNPCLNPANQGHSTVCGICPALVPNCEGKSCGPNGAGGTCGSTPVGSICVDGRPIAFPVAALPHTVGTSGVGTVAGSFSVTDGGQAAYTIPISLPPGRGGLTPQLALGYTSGSGNGFVGVGWSLDGLLAITRCNKTIATDGYAAAFAFADDDALCLNGERMIPVSTGTSTGGPTTTYQLEHDDFSIIVGFTEGDLVGPKRFEMTRPDGYVVTFGGTPGSRIIGGFGNVRTWAQSSLADRNGNYAEYAYETVNVPFGALGLSHTREYYPTSITYSLHSSDPHPQAVVTFAYDDTRGDRVSLDRAGDETQINRRLTKISVLSSNQNHSYAFAYDDGGSGLPLASRVSSVTECTGESIFEDPTTCKPPTTFSYEQGAGLGSALPAGDAANQGVQLVGDFNGDGRDDLLVETRDVAGKYTSKIRFSEFNEASAGGIVGVTPYAYREVTPANAPLHVEVPRLSVLDYDNDGRDDILDLNALTVFRAQGDDFQKVALDIPGLTSRFQLDVDGDGRPDLLDCEVTSGAAAWRYRRLGPDGYEAAVEITAIVSPNGTPLPSNAFCPEPIVANFQIVAAPWSGDDVVVMWETENASQVIDVDGDGTQELLYLDEPFRGRTSSSFTPWPTTDMRYQLLAVKLPKAPTDQATIVIGPTAIPSQAKQIDINGDGLKDFCEVSDHVSIWINNGKGFEKQTDVLFPQATHWTRVWVGGDDLQYARDDEQIGGGQVVQDTSSMASNLARIVDVDRDGREDMLLPVPVPSTPLEEGPFQNRWAVLRSTGTTLQFADLPSVLAWEPLPRIAYENLEAPGRNRILAYIYSYKQETPVLLDANGDGFQDVLMKDVQYNADPQGEHPSQWTFMMGSGSGLPRMTSVTNGLRQRTEIRYQQLTDTTGDSAVYTPNGDPGACVYPQRCSSPRHSVVAGHDVGGVDAQDEFVPKLHFKHTYTDGRRDLHGRGWLGFASRLTVKTTATTPVGYTEQTTIDFDNATLDADTQLYPGVGRPTRIGQEIGSNDSLRGVQVFRVSDFLRPSPRTLFTYTKEERRVAGEIDEGFAATTTSDITTRVDSVDKYGNPLLVIQGVPDSEEESAYAYGFRSDVPEGVRFLAFGYKWTSDASFDKPGLRHLPEFSGDLFQITGAASPRNSDVANARYRQTEYDSKGNVRRVIENPEGTVSGDDIARFRLQTDIDLDGFGNVIGTTKSNPSEGSRASQTMYDQAGYLPVEVVNEKGQHSAVVVDPRYGATARIVDPNGIIQDWVYDGFGRLGTRIDADGTRTDLAYRALDGNTPIQVETTQEGGLHQTADFDWFGRQVKTSTTGFGGAELIGNAKYDDLGHVISRIAPHRSGGADSATADRVATTQFTYDQRGRLSDRTWREVRDGDEEQVISGTCYGPNLSCTQDVRGFTRCEQRDSLGRVVATYDPQHVTGVETVTFSQLPSCSDVLQGLHSLVPATLYEYGEVLERTFDAAGQMTTIVPDQYGRKVQLTDPDTGVHHYEWNAFGELVHESNANAESTDYEYDPLGRRVLRRDNDFFGAGQDAETRWYWDGEDPENPELEPGELMGALTLSVSAEGHKKRYRYDAIGQLVDLEQTMADSDEDFHVGFSQYLHGRPQIIDYPSASGGVGLSVRQQFDGSGRLTSVSDANRTGPGALLWSLQETNGYDQLHREALGTALSTTYDYDNLGRTVRIADQSPTGVSRELGLTYDWNGSIESRAQTLVTGGTSTTQVETFEYDELQRLTKSHIGQFSTLIGYDPFGNILSKSGVGIYQYASGRPHAVSKVGIDDYDYDDIGQVKARTNETTGDSEHYKYTRFGKPTVMWKNGETPAEGENVTSMGYDADGNRVRKSNPSRRITYVGGLYERRLRSDGVSDEEAFYISNGERVVAQLTKTNGGSGAISYLHSDHLGSPEVITDAAGTVLSRQSFDAFGRRRNPLIWSQGANVGNGSTIKVDYTGHETEEDGFELVHMQGRQYDPRTGRFMTPDPFVQAPLFSQSLNRYSYVFNDPLTNVDPTGYDGEEARDGGYGGTTPVPPPADIATPPIPPPGGTSPDGGYGATARIPAPGRQPKPDAGPFEPGATTLDRDTIGRGMVGNLGMLEAGLLTGGATALGFEGLGILAAGTVAAPVLATVGTFALGYGAVQALMNEGEVADWAVRVVTDAGTASDYFALGNGIGGAVVGAVAGFLGSLAADVAVPPAGRGAANLHAEAVAARDALAADLKQTQHSPATVVGAYSPSSGQVTAGASRGGGLGCAEGVCSEALGHPADIRFTPAVRPRTGKPVDVCPTCESTYGRGAFPDPATRFRTDRGGQ
jgi:RHS repeat-associated protein